MEGLGVTDAVLFHPYGTREAYGNTPYFAFEDTEARG